MEYIVTIPWHIWLIIAGVIYLIVSGIISLWKKFRNTEITEPEIIIPYELNENGSVPESVGHITLTATFMDPSVPWYPGKWPGIKQAFINLNRNLWSMMVKENFIGDKGPPGPPGPCGQIDNICFQEWKRIYPEGSVIDFVNWFNNNIKSAHNNQDTSLVPDKQKPEKDLVSKPKKKSKAKKKPKMKPKSTSKRVAKPRKG